MNFEIPINISLKGRYKLSVHDKDGNIKRETGWFDNIITDNGLELIGTTGDYLAHFAVGSGNNTPAVTDTALQTEIAASGTSAPISGAFAGTVTRTIDSGNRQFTIERSYQFGEGVAEGNISEIGIGNYNTNLFSRALILDGGGSPTTITVLSNEFLTVTYQLIGNQPTTDFSATVNGYSVTGRMMFADSTTYWGHYPARWSLSGGVNPQQIRVWSGSIGALTSGPSGSAGNRTSVSNDSYIPASHERTGNVFWSINTGNFEGGILSCSVNYNIGWFQFGFSPAIDKDNTKELTLYFKLSWARA